MLITLLKNDIKENLHTILEKLKITILKSGNFVVVYMSPDHWHTLTAPASELVSRVVITMHILQFW